MKEIIDVTNLNFSWGNNHVLKDLNLNLKENELVSIIGINGAGKSTLLSILQGQNAADKGLSLIHI